MRALPIAVAAAALAGPAAARPGEVVRVEHRDPSMLPSRGPAGAPVTIELFFTPGPWRGQAYRYLEELQARHPSHIRLVYRVLAANGSARLPYAALEAQAEGKFSALMDALARERGNPDDARLLEIGRQLGLDPVRLENAMHHPPAAYERVIAENDRRRRQRIRGGALPSALFNGRLPQTQLAALTASELEAEYRGALDRAEDLIDRGADPAHLAEAFDREEAHSPVLDVPVQPGPTDEELDQVPADPPLANPPLRTRGLPSFGPADAPVQILVLCSPTSANCPAPLHAAMIAQDNFPDRVRVVWAPYFDLARDDAAELGLLGDAALCAERVGTTEDLDFDRPASPGWRWVESVLQESIDRRRQLSAEQLIAQLADRLGVDRDQFAACRARVAGTTLAWIEAARHAGVRTTPATVVGGRIYGPITDSGTLQLLVETELAPGDCDVDHGCLHLDDYAPSWRRGL